MGVTKTKEQNHNAINQSRALHRKALANVQAWPNCFYKKNQKDYRSAIYQLARGNSARVVTVKGQRPANGLLAEETRAGLLHHSDRGSQYASHEYREHLTIMKMEQCMSRKGNCWSNSPMERFFRSLKHEQLNYEKFGTKEAAKLSIIDYLAFCNGKRTHSKFGYQSPLEFERSFYKKVG